MTRQSLEDAGAQMLGTVSLSRLLRGSAVVVLALSIGGALVGCALVGDDAQSGQASAAGASAEQAMSTPAEKIMSGEYEVGPDGKLLNPNRNKTFTPPQLPKASQTATPEDAQAFAEYVFASLEYAWTSGDTQPIRQVSESSCIWCRDIPERIEQSHQNAEWVEGMSIRITKQSKAFEIPDHPGIWHQDVEVATDKFRQYKDGKILELPAKTMSFTVQTVFKNGRWSIYEIGSAFE